MKSCLRRIHTYSSPEPAFPNRATVWDASGINITEENKIRNALYRSLMGNNKPLVVLPLSVKEELEHYRESGKMKAGDFRKITLLELNSYFRSIDIESLSHTYEPLDKEIHNVLPNLANFTSKSIFNNFIAENKQIFFDDIISTACKASLVWDNKSLNELSMKKCIEDTLLELMYVYDNRNEIPDDGLASILEEDAVFIHQRKASSALLFQKEIINSFYSEHCIHFSQKQEWYGQLFRDYKYLSRSAVNNMLSIGLHARLNCIGEDEVRSQFDAYLKKSFHSPNKSEYHVAAAFAYPWENLSKDLGFPESLLDSIAIITHDSVIHELVSLRKHKSALNAVHV